MTYEYQQYLEHHGIKGQKWGKRRYQNEDGSLTEEGRKRYGVLTSSQLDELFRKSNRQDYKEETREAAKKEHDALLKRAEINRKIKTAVSVASTLYMANLLTGGALSGLAKRSVSSIVNSKMVYNIGHSFVKRHAYKKMGAIVLNKRNYKIFGNGLMGG